MIDRNINTPLIRYLFRCSLLSRKTDSSPSLSSPELKQEYLREGLVIDDVDEYNCLSADKCVKLPLENLLVESEVNDKLLLRSVGFSKSVGNKKLFIELLLFNKVSSFL